MLRKGHHQLLLLLPTIIIIIFIIIIIIIIANYNYYFYYYYYCHLLPITFQRHKKWETGTDHLAVTGAAAAVEVTMENYGIYLYLCICTGEMSSLLSLLERLVV